jgi:hypothetical protein
MQAIHDLVTRMIQKGNDDLKYYKKLRRFCVKIPMIKVKKRNWTDIEYNAQPLISYVDRMEEWVIYLLASFQFILDNTEENSELRNFMAAHWEHTDDLFIYKEFLKPIEIDDCKIMPSKYQEEKRYERRLKSKNIRKPDNDITTGIKCFEKIKRPIVSLFYYH